MSHALRYMTGHPLHFLGNYFVKLYNAFVYPLPGASPSSTAAYAFRLLLIFLGLVGLLRFGFSERGRSRLIMVPILGYYVAFTALFHITQSGRMNLPMKVLFTIFAAYSIVELATRYTDPPEQRSAEPCA